MVLSQLTTENRFMNSQEQSPSYVGERQQRVYPANVADVVRLRSSTYLRSLTTSATVSFILPLALYRLVFALCLTHAVASLAVGQEAVLEWSELTPMPAAVSGHFAGVSNDALVIVGGANFPDKSPFAGGTKAWYDRIAVLHPGAQSWRTGYQFGRTAAYGASASYGGRMICAGGGNGETHSREVSALQVTDTGLQIESLPQLPKPCSFTSGAVLGDSLYVVGGQTAPDSNQAMKNFWRLDLSADRNKQAWQTVEAWPGAGRILSVVTSSSDALYVFSGASLRVGEDGSVVRDYLKDAYRYSQKDGWKRLPNLPTAVVAGTAVVDGDRILVFSGDTGENFFRTAELGDKHPGFRCEVLAFDLKQQAWSTSGTIPYSLVTTNAVVWLKNGKRTVVLPGGEDRPGHRLANVLSLQLSDDQ
jgi:N-acetylneuraminate epimerase